MRPLYVFFLLLPSLFFLFSFEPSLAENRTIKIVKKWEKMKEEPRVALVIGNSSYQHVSYLKNPIYDAEDISNMLKKCGFYVITLLDASHGEMIKAIETFSAQIEQGGIGLFFYAGHAVQVKGNNYIIPVDSEINKEYQLRTQCVNVSEILGAMEYAQNRVNIVILDACRNNPFRSISRSVSRGLARMDAAKETLLVYATAPGKTASDGPGRNGVFTSALLKHILKPMEISALLRQVRKDVINITNDFQVPWDASSLTGEFYFTLPDPEKLHGEVVVKRVYVDVLENVAGLSDHFRNTWKQAMTLAEEGTEGSLNQALEKLKRLIDEATENDAVFSKLLKTSKKLRRDRDNLVMKRKAEEKDRAEYLRRIVAERAKIAEEKLRKAEEETRKARENLAKQEHQRKEKEARQIRYENEKKVDTLLKQITLLLEVGSKKEALKKYELACKLLPDHQGVKKYSDLFPRPSYNKLKDVIKMDNKAYSKHKKSIVTFPHKKHVEEYYAGCGECHHDANNKPLNNLKIGDDVQNCIECHKKPSERPKGKGAPRLNKQQRLEYHAEAIHYNCKGCHKKFNKKTGTKAAPTTCAKCHPKRAKR